MGLKKNWALIWLVLGYSAAYGVDGFAVSARGSNLDANHFGGYGDIVRVDIKNSKPGDVVTLWQGEGRYARISQDGKLVAFMTKDNRVMVLNADGSSQAKEIAKTDFMGRGCLAWINSRDIYFSMGGLYDDGSKIIKKVSADGGTAETIAEFKYKMWVFGFSADGKKAIVRTGDKTQEGLACEGSTGAVFKLTFPRALPITLNCNGDELVLSNSCGNAISPSGNTICLFPTTTHQEIAVMPWSGATEANSKLIKTQNLWSAPYGGGGRNNLTRWSSNSEDWICTYVLNKTQYLLNVKTQEFIKVNSTSGHLPGDFWVSGSASSISPKNALLTSSAQTISLVTRKGNYTLDIPSDADAISLYALDGRLIRSMFIPSGASAINMINLSTGAYLVRIQKQAATVGAASTLVVH